MRFRSEILCVAIAIGATSAFVPTAYTANSRSILMDGSSGRDLSPRDFIASNLKKKQAFSLTNTLRWEIRSTLTSDEEATTEEAAKKKEEEDIPEYPEQLRNGIWEIKNDLQHK